jgi:hypothetical protein
MADALESALMAATLNGISQNTPCPKVPEHGPMERREEMFWWRGTFSPGWVCVKCNALWSIKGEEMEPLRGTGI